MINLTDYNFKYEPYPYVILKNIFNHEFYKKIITEFPDTVDEGNEISELENVGTTILSTDNIKYKYNFQNITVPQDQTKKIDYVDFLPNQMMLFVKTHNSLHSVGPIIAKEKKDLFRKSINICIVKQF